MQFRDFLPVSTNTGLRECVVGALGAFIGLCGTGLLCQWALGIEAHWLIAPMGASAVLLFAAPASPLAQPWSILVGNGVSALMGVASATLVPDPALASALAVTLAIGAMFLTRSLHPPGGAVALTAVIGGEGIRQLGVGYVLLPVLINSSLLLVLGLCYNRLLGRRYPNGAKVAPNPHQTADPQPSARLASATDIDFALKQHGELLDISRQDLQVLLQEAQLHALRERVGTVRCLDVMSKDLVVTSPDEPAMAAWQLLSHHRIKALPVVEGERLVGILTLHDLMIDKEQQPRGLQALETQRVVALMTSAVRTAQSHQPLHELVAAFSDGGLHHMPVLEGNRLVGILTQSDMVAALFNLALGPGLTDEDAPPLVDR